MVEDRLGNEDAHETAVLARVCERAWRESPEAQARLTAAGFRPGKWPRRDELAALSILNKSDIANVQGADPPFGSMRSRHAGPVACLFCSPGQIFEPDMPSAQARLGRMLREQGFDKGDVVLNGFNYHLTPAGLLFHNALVNIGCTVIPGGPQNIDAMVDVLVRSGAVGFVGIAAHLKTLVDRFFVLGYTAEHLRLRKAMAGGEPGASSIRSEMRSRHGINVCDMYGTAEVGIVAVEAAEGSGLHFDNDVIVEVVDPVTSAPVLAGELGHVILTVDNAGYPMLRLGTGDVGKLSIAIEGETAPRPRLCLTGRLGASARVRGMLLHEAQVLKCLHAHPAIQAIQIQITREGARDGIVAVLQATDSFGDAATALSECFQSACRLRLDQVITASTPLGDTPLIVDHRAFERDVA